MDDQILLPDGGEAVAALIADALGVARIVGHEFEVRPVQAHELRQLVEREHAVNHEHLVIAASERALNEAPQLRRHRGVDFEPDDRTAPAALEHGLELAHQVFGFFLDLDLAVADDAEGALPFDRIAGKQPADEQAGQLLERNHPDGRASIGVRQADEAIDLAGNADERIHRPAVARAGKLQRDGEAEIGNERERVRGVDGERREQRKNLLQEMILEPGLFLLGHVRSVDQHDALLGERLAQFAPALLLVAGQHRDGLGNAGELLGRRQPVGALGGDAGAHLALEAGDADHGEFVEVVGRDREKADPLQQRVGFVGRLLEHAPVEMQPGQLTVDESLRA